MQKRGERPPSIHTPGVFAMGRAPFMVCTPAKAQKKPYRALVSFFNVDKLPAVLPKHVEMQVRSI